MTKQEQIEKIQEIINDCYVVDSYITAEGSEGRYIDTEEAAKAIVEAGYGNISEYKAEIERLITEFKQLETNAEILAWGVRDLNHENYELTEKVKQAQIDVLNRVMTYINNKIENDYGDMSDSVKYLTVDIDDFDDFIDELIKEIEKQ